MRRSSLPSDIDAVELESLVQDEEEGEMTLAPDAPLSMRPPFSPRPSSLSLRPKWLTHDHLPWYQRLAHVGASSAILFLWPRFTWRYVLCASLALYALYCSVRQSPLFAYPLPTYEGGPYGVGVIDIEIPLPDGPKRISDAVLRRSGEPAFDVETVLVSLYYPTNRAFQSSQSRYYWVPKPISLTAEGYAKVAHIDNFITRPIFTFFLWAIAGSVTIPAEVNAPLFDEGGDQGSSSQFPVIIFSHGMASSRTDYTNFLGELASRGSIIAAVEHRDGSCPGSMIKHPGEDGEGRRRLYIGESDLAGDGMNTPEFKRIQLAFRDVEMLAAIDMLRSINDGSGLAYIAANNTRSPSASTLSTWPSRLDIDKRLIIAGHSYGATGALQALTTIAPGAAAGLILDPGKSSGPLNHNSTAPLLIIHSNSWSRSHSIFYGRPHFDTVRDLVRAQPAPSWFLTSLGTSHPSVTDAPLLEPLLLSWTTGANLDVKGALKQYVNVSQEFLDFSMHGKLNNLVGLLAEDITHEEYNVWVSDERKKTFPKSLAKLWEIHVTPEV
ncbi:platelet-activating factor acetylhydrolase [Geosmithia morbida]|uniref:Putative phospholipase n=1 Tax=Geosmithia morbida TaxID=1094350 RepID=A0A9P4YTP4_9HYPO|nr:platelet-activating factor acetylhydrolase [Geosmithia morbida]KAF4122918.1 platelet-activating factor acetylhydrolase [Geosmithia morbida]